MIKDPATVEGYAKHHSQLIQMLEDLTKFVATMPAPDEDGNIPYVDYGYTGDVARIHALVSEAQELTYELSE